MKRLPQALLGEYSHDDAVHLCTCIQQSIAADTSLTDTSVKWHMVAAAMNSPRWTAATCEQLWNFLAFDGQYGFAHGFGVAPPAPKTTEKKAAKDRGAKKPNKPKKPKKKLLYRKACKLWEADNKELVTSMKPKTIKRPSKAYTTWLNETYRSQPAEVRQKYDQESAAQRDAMYRNRAKAKRQRARSALSLWKQANSSQLALTKPADMSKRSKGYKVWLQQQFDLQPEAVKQEYLEKERQLAKEPPKSEAPPTTQLSVRELALRDWEQNNRAELKRSAPEGTDTPAAYDAWARTVYATMPADVRRVQGQLIEAEAAETIARSNSAVVSTAGGAGGGAGAGAEAVVAPAAVQQAPPKPRQQQPKQKRFKLARTLWADDHSDIIQAAMPAGQRLRGKEYTALVRTLYAEQDPDVQGRYRAEADRQRIAAKERKRQRPVEEGEENGDVVMVDGADDLSPSTKRVRLPDEHGADASSAADNGAAAAGAAAPVGSEAAGAAGEPTSSPAAVAGADTGVQDGAGQGADPSPMTQVEQGAGGTGTAAEAPAAAAPAGRLEEPMGEQRQSAPAVPPVPVDPPAAHQVPSAAIREQGAPPPVAPAVPEVAQPSPPPPAPST